jgi:hypothetical protein
LKAAISLAPLVGRVVQVGEFLGRFEELGAWSIRVGGIPSDSGIVEAGFEFGSLEGGVGEAGGGWGSGGRLWFTIGVAEAVDLGF